MDIVEQRVCPRCEGEFDHTKEFFYADKNRKSGFSSYCKACCKANTLKHRPSLEVRRERSRAYRLVNPEKVKAERRAYYQANAPEIKARVASWEAENRDRVNARSRSYYAANKGTHAARVTRWRRNNPQAVAVFNNRRRVRLQANLSDYTAADIAALQKAQCNRCHWCRKPMKKFHVDHVIPLFKGGADTKNNICLSCPTCNSSKGVKLPAEFAGRLF